MEKKTYLQPEMEVITLDPEGLMERLENASQDVDDYAKKNNLGFSFYEDDEDEDV